jgi:hypothetical protein
MLFLNPAEIHLLPNKNGWNGPDENGRSNGMVHGKGCMDDGKWEETKGKEGGEREL